MQKGFGEKLFLWSDMSHYRRPSALCQAFIRQVDALDGRGHEDESEQFLAFALGYMTHVGTDTVAHSFVNEQCGGPYRNHPAAPPPDREPHRLLQLCADHARRTARRPTLRGLTDDYPSVSSRRCGSRSS